MAQPHIHHFSFVGGPCDGGTLPLGDQGDGYPDLLVVPWMHESTKGRSIEKDAPPEAGEYRYERDGDVYHYLGEAEPR